jgi:hypothetical protein
MHKINCINSPFSHIQQFQVFHKRKENEQEPVEPGDAPREGSGHRKV